MPWGEVSVMNQRHEFVRLALQEGEIRWRGMTAVGEAAP